MRKHQAYGAQCQRHGHHHVHGPAVIDKQLLHGHSGEEPDQVGDGSGKRKKESNSQQYPERMGIGQHKGGQGSQAENNDFYIGKLQQKSGAEAGQVFAVGKFDACGVQHMPCQPQDVSGADPGEDAHILVQNGSQKISSQNGEHGYGEKSGEKPPPLAKSRPASVFQGGGQRAKIRRSGRDGSDVAVDQKRRDHGSRHRMYRPFR